jgi:hypothetical protein
MTRGSGRSREAREARILELHRQGRAHRAIAATLEREGSPLGKSQIAAVLARLRAEGAPVRHSRRARGKAASAAATTGRPAAPAPRGVATATPDGSTGAASAAPPSRGKRSGAARRSASTSGSSATAATPSSPAKQVAEQADPLAARGLVRRPPVPIPPDIGDEDADTSRARLRKLRALIDANEAAAMSGEVSFASWAAAVRLEADLVDRVIAQIVPVAPEAADPNEDPANLAAAEQVRHKLERLVAQAELDVRCTHCGQAPFAPAREGAARG